MYKEHVAILNPQQKMLGKIVDGTKIIESRWYKNRVKPWNAIKKGDSVYFKESGGKVCVVAKVREVKQNANLDEVLVRKILTKHQKDLGIENVEKFFDKVKHKNYCILIFLEQVKTIEPFAISKKGFGSQAAWISVTCISEIKIT